MASTRGPVDFRARAAAYAEEGHTQEDALFYLRRMNAELNGAAATDEEIEEAVALSGAKPEHPEPEDVQDANLTDAGNARRLVARYRHEIRYVPAWKKWLRWDGRRWARDDAEHVQELAKQTAGAILDEARAMDASQYELRTKLTKWGFQSEMIPRLEAMVKAARSVPGIPVAVEALDGDPWLLNLANGTLDLRTGRLRPHRRGDLLTKLAPVAWNPAATCPTWEAFLERVTRADGNLMDFLQRAVGYALTASTAEQVLFLLYGTGANGKSTFIETLLALLGDYAHTASFSTFLASHQDKATNDLARLRGARFVSAIEAESGNRLAESTVKQLTGGDVVTARFLYAEFFEFRPTFKLFLAANHRPEVRGTDHAIWRRIRLVPFTVTIPEEERDKDLPEKLRAELPGILRWAVDGCMRWQRVGLEAPESVQAATQEYREDMDILSGFLLERCEVRAGASASAKELWSAYLAWSEDNKDQHVTQKTFGTRLRERGFEKARSGSNGSVVYRGLGLKDGGLLKGLNDPDA